jgi:FAD/FMN-containing dehydrogenase
VNEGKTVASVGAGARWLDVYAELDKYGIQVAGGRNGNVGVGGLLLGGGISYFGPRVGWACDNVVNFEVVLPSGLLVNANATSHSDLFRALKGGANNFGVVTRFDLAAFPQGEILAGAISTTIENVDAVFEAFAEIAGAENYDPYASLVTGLTFSSDAKAWVGVGTTAIYTKPVENPGIYEEFLSIPDTTSTQHLTNLSTFSNETQTPPL